MSKKGKPSDYGGKGMGRGLKLGESVVDVTMLTCLTPAAFLIDVSALQ